MHTQDELRAGMNALASVTEPLVASTLLHEAKRHRTRRRLLTAASTVAAVIAVTAGAVVAAPFLNDRNSIGHGGTADTRPAVTGPASVPPTRTLPREQRFEFGKEQQSDSGVYTTLITDRSFPDLDKETEIRLDRAPGQKTVITSEDQWTGDVVRHLTVAGIRIRVDEYQVADGTTSELQWSRHGTGYVLTADRGTTDDGVAYGATADDLGWLVEEVMRRNPK